MKVTIELNDHQIKMMEEIEKYTALSPAWQVEAIVAQGMNDAAQFLCGLADVEIATERLRSV